MNNTLNSFTDRDGRFGGGHHWGGPLLSLIVVLLVGAAVAALVMWLLRSRGPGAAPHAVPSATASAETILAERLARSEIDPTEYRNLLAALRGETPVEAAASAEPTPES